MKRLTSFASALLLAASACGTSAVDELPDFEDFFDGKMDTGYVGSRAAELEATFTGKVRVAQPGKTKAELDAIAAKLLADPTAYELSSIVAQVSEQMKYARNALKKEQIDLNLEGGSPTFSKVDVLPGALELSYTVKIESLVKFKELAARGLTPASLVGKVVEPKLPLTPLGLYERIGGACATEDDGGPVPAADLRADNLFYYFDPARTGCTLGAADLVTARYSVTSSANAPTVYPEYDKLVADGKITMVALFGQIEHGPTLARNDWGWIAYDTISEKFQAKGFRVVETYPGERGQKMAKTYTGGLVVEVDMRSPVNFADSVPRDQANVVFKEAMSKAEVVYYNGHAFYGSLTVLDDPAAYPPNTYQIVFMDACWSYAYYTKQVFRNKMTATDKTGWALADVINNTEPGITGSEETAAILYHNLFTGAATVYRRGDARKYSWNNLIKYMNESADRRAAQRAAEGDTDSAAEIYGVSGVRTNTWKP